MKNRYRNPWARTLNIPKPEFYENNGPQVFKHRGVEIFRVHDRQFDFVLSGCCIAQRAGFTATEAAKVIDGLLDGETPVADVVAVHLKAHAHNPITYEVLGFVEGMLLAPKIYRFHDRDIIRVTLPSGEVQPFYRSTGKNSGKAGEWLPFDGLQLFPTSWFDKDRFTKGAGMGRGQELHRYGTHDLKIASEALGFMEIPEGVEAKAQKINRWLGTERAMEWYHANAANQ